MPETTSALEELRQSLPEPAKDLKLNLQSVLKSEALSPNQVFGVALASAYFLKNPAVRDAIADEAELHEIDDATIDDARAAAAIMGMNTVYYRFRHMVGKPEYAQKPARLRMNRMMKPATGKADFELFSLACAVLAPCEACIQSHEASVLKQGLTEDHVHDVVRIAATLSGVATALSL